MAKSIREANLEYDGGLPFVASNRGSPIRVAVIGAGISGLICARALAAHGVSVAIFEKSGGVGGRMATRRTNDGLSFDHGAQYFTVSDSSFGKCVQAWRKEGLIEKWNGRIRVLRQGRIESCNNDKRRFVGIPAMTSICKYLATDLDVHLCQEIASLRSIGKSWRPIDKMGKSQGTFDCVIVAIPSAQAARFLEPIPELAKLAERIEMQPCWTVMAVFDQPLPVDCDGAFVNDSILSWVARNSSKPARSRSKDCWVLHGSVNWSQENFQIADEEVKAVLLDEFWRVTDLRPFTPSSIDVHRWRYAKPLAPLDNRCLFDAISGLGACGDWCLEPRVQGAFLSGCDVAKRVLHATGLV